jgi:hypothetical protein
VSVDVVIAEGRPANALGGCRKIAPDYREIIKDR